MPISAGPHLSTDRALRRRPWGKPPWRGEVVPTVSFNASHVGVAIIGGGLTGVSAAYHLAQRGVRANVFEAGLFGDGASGRSGGIVLEGTARGILPGTDRCIEQLREIVGAQKIACELELAGCWEIEHARAEGDSVLPWRDAGCAIRIRRSVAGGTADPMALLGGLAQAAARAGASFHEQTPVEKIVHSTQPAVEIKGALVRADFIVVAVNAWTSALLPEVRPVRSALTTACATEPLSLRALEELGLGPAARPFYTVDLPYLWGRMLGQNQVIFGAGLVFGPPAALEQVDLGEEEPRRALEQLKARVRGLHPALNCVEFAAQWAGPVAITDNFAPLIGRLPHAPSVIAAGAYSGHGIALSVWMGAMIAQAVTEDAALPEWGTLTE
jgi:gamma-glutamylputrescine oxidase